MGGATRFGAAAGMAMALAWALLGLSPAFGGDVPFALFRAAFMGLAFGLGMGLWWRRWTRPAQAVLPFHDRERFSARVGPELRRFRFERETATLEREVYVHRSPIGIVQAPLVVEYAAAHTLVRGSDFVVRRLVRRLGP